MRSLFSAAVLLADGNEIASQPVPIGPAEVFRGNGA